MDLNYNNLKTKKQKWLEVTVVIGGILLLVMILIFITSNNEAANEAASNKQINLWDLAKYIAIAGIGILIGLFLKRKSENRILPAEEIINHVANEEHNNRGILLSTKSSNVTTERGLDLETYVEFFDEAITFLFEDGIGIRERHPGRLIIDIKGAKQKDAIEMERAKTEIRVEKDRKMMNVYDRVDELK